MIVLLTDFGFGEYVGVILPSRPVGRRSESQSHDRFRRLP